MSKSTKQKLLEDFLAKAKKEDIDEVVVFGINSEDRTKCMSVMESKNAASAMAMIGMLIKLLADDIEMPSYKLAERLAKNLKETEETVAKVLKEKKTLHIKITTDDDEN